MKLLLIAPHCDGTDVGEAKSTYKWVSGLAEHHDVTLLTYTKRGAIPARAQLGNCEVVEWRDIPLAGRFERFNSMAKPGYFWFYLLAKRWLRQSQNAGRKFDLVHQLSPLAPRYPSPAADFDIPYVIGPLGGSLRTPNDFVADDTLGEWYKHLRALDALRFRHDRTLNKTISRAALVLGVAPYVQSLLKIKSDRFALMSEAGIDELHIRPNSSHPNSKVRLLFVGRVIRNKGVRELIMAVARLSNKDKVKVDIVGTGDDLVTCKKLVSDLHLNNLVHFQGHLSQAEVFQYYATADVFVFPSFREPSGNVVLEAMSFGLPLIVADYGGPGHIVKDNFGQRISVSSSSLFVEGLSNAIGKFTDDAQWRVQCGASAREAASEYLWPEKIKRLNGLYQQIWTQDVNF